MRRDPGQNFKTQGACGLQPVAFNIPGYPMNRIGWNGCTDFRFRSIHPCGGKNPFAWVIKLSGIGKNSNGGIGVIRIDNLKIQIDNVGSWSLGNSTDCQGGVRVGSGKPLVR